MLFARPFGPRLLAPSLLALLAACGGSAAKPALARLEVTPGALLLPSQGASQRLTVRAFDTAGNVMDPPPLSFVSSRPGDVTAAADGTLTAVGPVGSALVTVSGGGVVSSPVMVAVAELAPGAVLVSDEQVAAPPTPVDPAAVPSLGAQFRVTLIGLPTPPAGALLVGTGSQPVSGRVLSTADAGGGVAVTYELVGPETLFRNLSVDLTWPAAQTRGLVQPAGSPAGPVARKLAPGAPIADLSHVGAIACEADAPTLALLSVETEIKVDPSVDVRLALVVTDSVIQRLTVAAEGTLQATGKIVVSLGGSVTGAASCSALLGFIPIPITGVLSPIIAPIVPIKAKVELGAQVGASLLSVGAEVQAEASVGMGIDYSPATGLVPLKSIGFKAPTAKPAVNVPSQAGVRSKVNLFAGLASGLAVGGALARLELAEVAIGPEIEVKVGGPYDVSQDPVFDTGYELKGKVGIGPGKDFRAALDRLALTALSADLSAKVEEPVASTARAVTRTVDRESYTAGAQLTFDVKLDPATVDFPVVGYDVAEVRIYRLDHAASTATQIAAATAAPGQTDFQLRWTATAAGSAVDPSTRKPTFYAFLVDRPLGALSDLFPFELGPVAATPPGAITCTPAKRYCGVSAEQRMFASMDFTMFASEQGNVYASVWTAGGGIVPFPEVGSPVGTSYLPPRWAAPARSGRFVAREPNVWLWYLVDMSDPARRTTLLLPSKTAANESIYWKGTSDAGWVVGAVTKAGGATVAVRLNASGGVFPGGGSTGTLEAPVEELAVAGTPAMAFDVNDQGQIVGTTDNGARIFIWTEGGVTYLDHPPGTGSCSTAYVNQQGDVLATCTDLSPGGTYAWIWWGGAGAPVKVTTDGSTPVPATFAPARVNALGQVVAATVVNGQYTDIVVWQDGATVSLLANTGWDQGEPVQLNYHAWINDQGQIGVLAVTDASGAAGKRVYLVSPNAAWTP